MGSNLEPRNGWILLSWGFAVICAYLAHAFVRMDCDYVRLPHASCGVGVATMMILTGVAAIVSMIVASCTE